MSSTFVRKLKVQRKSKIVQRNEIYCGFVGGGKEPLKKIDCNACKFKVSKYRKNSLLINTSI